MPYSWYSVTSGLEEIMAQMCGVEESVPETLLFLLSTLSPFYSFFPSHNTHREKEIRREGREAGRDKDVGEIRRWEAARDKTLLHSRRWYILSSLFLWKDETHGLREKMSFLRHDCAWV